MPKIKERTRGIEIRAGVLYQIRRMAERQAVDLTSFVNGLVRHGLKLWQQNSLPLATTVNHLSSSLVTVPAYASLDWGFLAKIQQSTHAPSVSRAAGMVAEAVILLHNRQREFAPPQDGGLVLLWE